MDDVVRWAVGVLAVAGTIAVVAWFFLAQRVPERAASHGSDRLKADSVGGRPAGPGAENMDATRSGGSTPPGQPDGASLTPGGR
jgi:hypothetical protein